MSTLPQSSSRTSDQIIEDSLLVQASFDADEKRVMQMAAKEDKQSWPGGPFTEDAPLASAELTYHSFSKDEHSASHARSLSEQIFDAARINDTASPIQTSQGVSFDENSHRGLTDSYPIQQLAKKGKDFSSTSTHFVPPVSPASHVGQKHSRGFSDDLAIPPHAHRRIDSIGSVAPVERSPTYYGSFPNPTCHDPPAYSPVPAAHHRKKSEGLDFLAAAVSADISKEEFAAAAVAPSPSVKQPNVEPPTDAPRPTRHSPHEAVVMRTSPSNVSSGPTYGNMGAPPVRVPHSLQPGYHPSSQSGYHPPAQHGYHVAPGFYSPYPYYPSAAPPHGGAPAQGYNPRQSPTMAYPIQYATQRGPDRYAKGQFYQPQQPIAPATSDSSRHSRAESAGIIENDERHFANGSSMAYQAPPAQWGGPPRPGTTTGSQTFVTAISVGEGTRTIHPTAHKKSVSTNTDRSSNDQPPPIPTTVGHHRKLSSFSSLSTLMNVGIPPGDLAPQDPSSEKHSRSTSNMSFLHGIDDKTMTGHGGHHRSTSSVSFFPFVDDSFDPHETFTQGMEGSAQPYQVSNVNSSPFGSAHKGHHYGASYGGGQPRFRENIFLAPGSINGENDQGYSDVASGGASRRVQDTQEAHYLGGPYGGGQPRSSGKASGSGRISGDNYEGSSSLASGGTSKRVRRKCSVDDCPNRVVQGGLCIAHGAKRKTCKHPGCKKNVKKAGLCSSHGPARKRCEVEGCGKVSVQGGRCIAHGAKKKLCHVEGCKKQAILSGYCKKHHDQISSLVPSGQRDSDTSQRTSSPAIGTLLGEAKPEQMSSQPTHTRGLSIFQEENIQSFLCSQPLDPKVK